jgi:hypothetical protein
MYIELLAVECILSRWSKNQAAPIAEISPFYGDSRSRPYSAEEVNRMKDFLRNHCPATYERIFGEANGNSQQDVDSGVWTKVASGDLSDQVDWHAEM